MRTESTDTRDVPDQTGSSTAQNADSWMSVAREVSAYLDLKPPFSAQQLAHALQDKEGQRICIVPHPMTGTLYGMCTIESGIYFVFYRSDGTEYQQERIIFHELSHILFGHVSGDEPVVVMRDGMKSTAEEREAECLAVALMLYARLKDSEAVLSLTTPRPTASQMSQLSRFMDTISA